MKKFFYICVLLTLHKNICSYPFLAKSPQPHELAHMMGTHPYDYVRGHIIYGNGGIPVPLTHFAPYTYPHTQPIIQVPVYLPQQPAMNNTVYCNMHAVATQSQLNGYRQMLDEYKKKFCDFFGINKKNLLIGGIFVTYVTLVAMTLYANAYLQKQELWSTWRSDLSIDELLTIPQRDLAESLITAVQARYAYQQHAPDFVNSLVSFIKDIDTEISYISFYERFFSWVNFCKMYKVLPTNTQVTHQQLQDRIRRLKHMRNTFLSWSTEYKAA